MPCFVAFAAGGAGITYSYYIPEEVHQLLIDDKVDRAKRPKNSTRAGRLSGTIGGSGLSPRASSENKG